VDVVETLRSALQDRYAIERELGQGGMATVYLAEDLKHHRKVALKVLRPEIAVTVGAGRFSREIEVAARLQHPNILPLLDSGEAAGFFFYVMPYVEGESLRERLARGGELPVQEAVRILMEVADALSEAHAHGVVHRDIKPDNVMLRGRHALVADFGVAKAVTEATGQQLLTSTGVALGTPTYMAPEQAMADPHQDHRVDIYALGVLGYELLTGRAPFSATTAQEMLAAHVTAVPDPVEKYRAAVSPALAAIIMKCLAKKPADRWQSAEEVLQHLEPLATPSGGTTPTQTAPVEAVRARRRLVAATAVGGVVALAAVAALAFQILRPKPLTITASDMTQITSDAGVEFQPAISPDGKGVAFVAGPIGNPHLVIRSTANISGEGEARAADTSLLRTWFPVWSPDGDRVRFQGCRAAGCVWNETGKMGGAVRPVPLPPRARASGTPAWSPDGSRVAFSITDTIFVSSAADTTPRLITVDSSGQAWLHSLAWSPDGRRIAYVNGNPEWRNTGNVNRSFIRIVSAEGDPPEEVVADEHLNVSPTWLDDRHLLFVSNRDGPRGAYVVEVGPHGRRGEPRLVPGIADPHSISYSVSAHTLAYAKFTMRQNIWSYPLGRSGPVSIRDGTPVTSGNQVIETHDISPDGRWLAFSGNRRETSDIYKVPVGGGEAVQLTSLPGDEFNPRWSPDGREITFYGAGSAGVPRLMLVPAEGGTPSILPTLHGESPSWAADGRSIVFQSNRTGQYRAWLISRDSVGGAWHEERQFGNWVYCDGAPDGSGLLCVPGLGYWSLVSPEGREIWRRKFFPSSGLVRVQAFRFAPDGKTLFLNGTHRDGRVGVWALPLQGGSARLVVAFDDPALAHFWMGTSVGRDRLFLTVSEYESDIWVAKLKY
jgi:serine/threonine-protein kinase